MKTDIDLGLHILSAITEPGCHFTQREIAAFCDCSQTIIDRLERQAIKKLRFKMKVTPHLQSIED